MQDRLAEMPILQVCRRYRCADGLIEHIVPAPAPSPEHQEGITRTLWRCQSVLEPLAHDDDRLVLLGRDLTIPIGITS